jgi:iron(III) transport system substrate-binding protein
MPFQNSPVLKGIAIQSEEIHMNKTGIKALVFGLATCVLSQGITVDAQAQENELVVYSAVFAEYADKMKAEFEALNPGVKVHIINPGGTEAMIKKLEAEKGNPQADIMHSGDTANYLYAKKQGLLQPYAPKAPGFTSSIDIGGKKLSLSDTDNYYHVTNLMFTGIMYNEDVVKEKKLPLPKYFKDLGDPQYKDLVMSANPLKSSTAVTTIMASYQMYGDKVWEVWDAINKNISYYSNSSSSIYTLTEKGEFAFTIGLSRPVMASRKNGNPVDFIFPEDGSQVADNAMGIVAGARHPELAKKFIDFILSDQMQSFGAQYLYIPVKKGVLSASDPASLEAVSSKIKLVLIPDPSLDEKAKSEIQSKFGDYIRLK